MLKWHKEDQDVCGLMNDDIKIWTNLDMYEVIKRIAQDRQARGTYTASCRPVYSKGWQKMMMMTSFVTMQQIACKRALL